MKQKKDKIGRITVPKSALVQPHEFNVATILSWTGGDVEFIPTANNRATPDIRYEGLEWEIKSPHGKSSRTIENNMRLALRQSRNMIIDLSRMSLPEDKCIREIKRQDGFISGKHRIMIITKKHEIIKLFEVDF
ncbi:MAG: hypothetical protein Q4A25_00295 [Candidatus Saccharibacteria bacterium]|nr:hypothetical protein [Candidatus Saccharibacteria bacterium]